MVHVPWSRVFISLSLSPFCLLLPTIIRIDPDLDLDFTSVAGLDFASVALWLRLHVGQTLDVDSASVHVQLNLWTCTGNTIRASCSATLFYCRHFKPPSLAYSPSSSLPSTCYQKPPFNSPASAVLLSEVLKRSNFYIIAPIHSSVLSSPQTILNIISISRITIATFQLPSSSFTSLDLDFASVWLWLWLRVSQTLDIDSASVQL
jgi:hypothetical protein